MASGVGGSQCEACRGGIGLWQAAFTSECAHKFHIRCVSGRAACPVCAARWSDTPVTAPAPAPATTFSFAPTPPSSTGLFGKPPPSPFSSSTPSPAPANAFATPTPSSTGLFGQTAAAASNLSSQTTGLFGQPPPSTTPNPSSSALSITAPSNAFSFWTPPPSSTDLFGQTAAAAANSSQTGLFGQSPPSIPSPFSSSTPSLAPTNAFSFATSAPSWAANSSQTIGLFGQPSQSTPKPFWLDPPFATCPALSSTSQTTTGLFGQPSPSPTQNSSSGFSFSFPQAQPASSPPSPPSATQEPSCPVCHGAMGRGHATVTSECSHTFHLRCCSGSVCPVCGARWRDEVTVAPPASLTPSPPRPATNTPTTTPFPSTPLFGPQTSPPDTERPVFSDDEPVDQRPPDGGDAAQETASNGEVVLTTHCEHKAVPRDTALDSFAVLVHAKAPAEASSSRAPLDLVTVLDVSGSMAGSKLALLKRAMGFVIDHLGPGDRLSIVTFSCKARRVIRLTRMSDGGKVTTKGAVESLVAGGATNIGDGLRVAAEVLDGRRHRNPIASVILLSDGEDNQTLGGYGLAGCPKTYNDLVPPSLRRSGCNVMCPPVHTFGFGVDHDAAAMHAIAEATGGTFSFIQNHAVVQDSFAQCIGGLLSVAVQEARVAVECLHPGVRVRAIKSGRYVSRVDADGRVASVDVGELYADEERRFLLFLDVPVAAEDGGVTPLIKVSCTYKDAATGWFAADVGCDDASVERPVVVSDTEPCVEVARELFRVEAAEDIAAARAAAERGAHAEAARILDRRREASAATGLAGDERCAELVAELRELSARVADRREYEQTGRACLLAGMSSHAQQRASTVQLFAATAPSAPPAFVATPRFGATPAFGFGGFGPQQGSVFGTTGASSPFSFGASSSGASSPFSFGAGSTGASSLSPFTVQHASSAAPTFGSRFATPAMQSMVESSRKAREQQQSEPGGSIFGPMGKPAD
ncbi:unnamed protein product [Urochloa decumbens]|uniref:Uncharacterized protein n=1 Tax=Urochloa decumbens TaxID=240449 RepID=A0ABC8ZEL3_9POAL